MKAVLVLVMICTAVLVLSTPAHEKQGGHHAHKDELSGLSKIPKRHHTKKLRDADEPKKTKRWMIFVENVFWYTVPNIFKTILIPPELQDDKTFSECMEEVQLKWDARPPEKRKMNLADQYKIPYSKRRLLIPDELQYKDDFWPCMEKVQEAWRRLDWVIGFNVSDEVKRILIPPEIAHDRKFSWCMWKLFKENVYELWEMILLMGFAPNVIPPEIERDLKFRKQLPRRMRPFVIPSALRNSDGWNDCKVQVARGWTRREEDYRKFYDEDEQKKRKEWMIFWEEAFWYTVPAVLKTILIPPELQDDKTFSECKEEVQLRFELWPPEKRQMVLADRYNIPYSKKRLLVPDELRYKDDFWPCMKKIKEAWRKRDEPILYRVPNIFKTILIPPELVHDKNFSWCMWTVLQYLYENPDEQRKMLEHPLWGPVPYRMRHFIIPSELRRSNKFIGHGCNGQRVEAWKRREEACRIRYGPPKFLDLDSYVVPEAVKPFLIPLELQIDTNFSSCMKAVLEKWRVRGPDERLLIVADMYNFPRSLRLSLIPPELRSTDGQFFRLCMRKVTEAWRKRAEINWKTFAIPKFFRLDSPELCIPRDSACPGNADLLRNYLFLRCCNGLSCACQLNVECTCGRGPV